MRLLSINRNEKACLPNFLGKFMSSVQSLVTWSSDFSLNMPEIDAQHQSLIDLINQVWRATIDNKPNQSEIIRIIELLETYTVTHFTAEEIFMREIRYANFDEHKKAHESFVARIGREKLNVINGNRLNLDIVHYLKDWLINHILVADRDYSAAYEKQIAPTTMLGRFFKKLWS